MRAVNAVQAFPRKILRCEARFFLWDRIKARVAALPGIEAMSLARRVPLGLAITSNDFFIPGFRDSEADPPLFLDTTSVDEDYFGTLGLTLVTGRLIDSRDGWTRSPSRSSQKRWSNANFYRSDRQLLAGRRRITVRRESRS
jgi:hypothetical protein